MSPLRGSGIIIRFITTNMSPLRGYKWIAAMQLNIIDKSNAPCP